MLNALQHRINQHQQLTELRIQLLRLHKTLLETERVSYEQVRGRISSHEFLQLALNHPQFAWLQPLSHLILQLDDWLHADEPITEASIAALSHEIQTLLTPNEFGSDFATQYDAAFQRNPDVILAHADVTQLLKPWAK